MSLSNTFFPAILTKDTLTDSTIEHTDFSQATADEADF